MKINYKAGEIFIDTTHFSEPTSIKCIKCSDPSECVTKCIYRDMWCGDVDCIGEEDSRGEYLDSVIFILNTKD